MLLPQRNIHLFNAKSIRKNQPCQWFPWDCQALEWDTRLLAMLLVWHVSCCTRATVTSLGSRYPEQIKMIKSFISSVSDWILLNTSLHNFLSILYTSDVTGSNPSVSQCKQNFHRWKFWILIQHLLSLWEAQKGTPSQDLQLPSQLLPALPICLHPRGHMTCGWQCCDASHLESQRSQWTGQVEMNATADLSNSWESLNHFWILIGIHVTPKLSKTCCICSYQLFSMPYKSGAHSCQIEITPSMATTTNWP